MRSCELEFARKIFASGLFGQLVNGNLHTVHIVALRVIYTDSTLLLSGVSTPVVVAGESFVDALFVAAGQG